MKTLGKSGWTWAVVGALTLCAGVLFLWSPEKYTFYPRCLLYMLTGWQCPGCGGLRAVHHLLHAEVGEAFRCHALLVMTLPCLGAIGLVRVLRQRTGWPKVQLKGTGWILCVVVILIVFALWRNFEGLHGAV